MDYEPLLLEREPEGWQDRIEMWPYFPVDEKAVYAILPDRRYVMLRIDEGIAEWWSWKNKTDYDSYIRARAS